MERIFSYLRYSMQGNILSASSHDIHLYSTNSSRTKSSHIKVYSQVSLIDCLVFKQHVTAENSMSHTQKKAALNSKKQYEYGTHTEKMIYWQGNLAPPPPSRNILNLLNPPPLPPLLGTSFMDLWMAAMARKMRRIQKWQYIKSEYGEKWCLLGKQVSSTEALYLSSQIFK